MPSMLERGSAAEKNSRKAVLLTMRGATPALIHGVKVRIVSVPVPAEHFKTKEEAEQGSIAAARNWIDNRTRSLSSSSGPIGPFSSKKKKPVAA